MHIAPYRKCARCMNCSYMFIKLIYTKSKVMRANSYYLSTYTNYRNKWQHERRAIPINPIYGLIIGKYVRNGHIDLEYNIVSRPRRADDSDVYFKENSTIYSNSKPLIARSTPQDRQKWQTKRVDLPWILNGNWNILHFTIYYFKLSQVSFCECAKSSDYELNISFVNVSILYGMEA